jgi:pilus assembly protein TadC
VIVGQETTIVLALAAGMALAVYLVISGQPLGRPRPSLADIFREQDAQAIARAELGKTIGVRDPDAAYRPTGLEAALRPLIEGAGRAIARMLAVVHLGPDAAALERRLARAGTPMSASRFLGQQLLSGLLPAAAVVVLAGFGARPLGLSLPTWLALAAFALGYVVPLLLLDANIERRRRELLTEVPNLLDDILLATSAGLSVEAAVAEVTGRRTGYLAQTLEAKLRDARLNNGSVVDALASTASALDSPELEGVVAALRLAEERGAPLALTLRSQAQALRERQRHLIIRQAGTGLVRMTLVVGFSVIPALLLALLYPAAVRLLLLVDF